MFRSHRPLAVVLVVLALLMVYGRANATGTNTADDPPLPEDPDPPDDPDDPEEDVWCSDPTNWPGVVKNRSGRMMKIRGDLWNGSGQVVLFLWDGQDSDEDTDMCDVDYFTVVTSPFYLIGPQIEYDANEWTDYIFWSTWICEPDGSKVGCQQE